MGGRGARFGQTPANADTPLGQPSAAAVQTPATTLRAWSTFEHFPRYHNNYVGLRNRFGLLSEAYAYATFEDRINATRYFLDAALAFAHDNAARLKKMAADADRASIVGQSLATRSQIKRGGTIEVLMGEVDQEQNPVSGQMMYHRKDVVHPEQMVDMLWFEARTTEDVPAEYYVPGRATKALDLLRAHGIQMSHVTTFSGAPEQFEITGNTARPVAPSSIDTGQHGLRTLEGAWKPAASPSGPVDYWRVQMNQPLARLAFYLLAPTSDDGLTAWNALDDVLGGEAKIYPVLRKR